MPPIVAVIPARMASTRFPGKMLAAETGTPLIVHVLQAASRARSLSRVVVAADDERIAAAVRAAGGECVMTSVSHPNGSSRLAEAADLLHLSADTVVVNVQGDEPEIEPEVIDAAVGVLTGSPALQMSTVAVPITSAEERENPNIVKVVVRADSTAMYFSRCPIPFVRDAATNALGEAVCDLPTSHLRHVGLYAYRRSFLAKYLALTPTPLEKLESLEQLRVLEHGHAIGVAVVRGVRAGAGIDTPEQYQAFVKRQRDRDRS